MSESELFEDANDEIALSSLWGLLCSCSQPSLLESAFLIKLFSCAFTVWGSLKHLKLSSFASSSRFAVDKKSNVSLLFIQLVLMPFGVAHKGVVSRSTCSISFSASYQMLACVQKGKPTLRLIESRLLKSISSELSLNIYFINYIFNSLLKIHMIIWCSYLVFKCKVLQIGKYIF